MLDHDHIARHQLWAGDTGELVVGEVPRFDTKEHAKWTAFHMRVTNLRIELDRCQKALGILRIVGQDIGAELHFAACLFKAFTHLQRCQFGEIVNARVQQFRRLGDDSGAFFIAGVLPGMEVGIGGCQRLFKLGLAEMFESLQRLAVVWIDALICHDDVFFLMNAKVVRRAVLRSATARIEKPMALRSTSMMS